MPLRTHLPRPTHFPLRARLSRERAAQQGFTLVELLVAILIALFLLGGLLTIVQDNRRAFYNQSGLSQLQDSERLAMTMISDVIQSAGYFPNPQTNIASSLLPADGTFATAGQAIVGSGGWNDATADETITVRYVTSGIDKILNCAGATSGAQTTFVNQFSVDTVNDQLVCTVGGVAYPLVGGVTNLQIRYGVKRNFMAAGNSPDTYADGSQMAAADWGNVMSVVIQLTFKNPLYVAGQGQPQTLTFSRVVQVMGMGGVSIS